eukprot:3614257-Pyramimonas_sp.AAC.1
MRDGLVGSIRVYTVYSIPWELSGAAWVRTLTRSWCSRRSCATGYVRLWQVLFQKLFVRYLSTPSPSIVSITLRHSPGAARDTMVS